MKLKNNTFKILLILIMLVIPWLNSDSSNIPSIPKISQENNPFFEINPCKISLYEYFVSDIKSIYQDHYYFRLDTASSIKCFGRVTGIAVQQNNLETQFFISVGANSLINLLLQGSFWLLLFSFVKKRKSFYIENNLVHNVSIILTSYLVTFSIYSQQKYYDSNFYVFDLTKRSSYIFLFLIFLLLTKNFVEIYSVRSDKLFNFLPFIFLVFGIFSGFNLVFASLIFINSGIRALINREYNKKFLFTYLSLSFWWLINSNGSFTFKPGKFRGFTNSVYEFNSNLYWIAFFGLLIVGVFNELKINKQHFNLEKFTNYFSLSSFIIVITGLIASNFPALNLFSTYYLGLQRHVVELSNPFVFDEFGVKISWRGISPSSETVGEFFGLCLLFNLFFIMQNKKLNIYTYTGVISASIGLYFSDNRTSIVLVFLIIVIYFLKTLNFNIQFSRKYLRTSIFSLILISIYIYFQTDTFEFYSLSILSNARLYQYDSIYSSYLLQLNESYDQKSLLYYLFGLFSSIGLMLNRSEMWGIFFARYNPTFIEVLVGSGPLTLGQLYDEIKIDDLESFLLPHSSLLSYLVYFGLIPLIFVLYKLFKIAVKNKNNFMFSSVFIFIFLNVIKNDSLNYFSNFLFYFSILYVLNVVETTKVKS